MCIYKFQVQYTCGGTFWSGRQQQCSLPRNRDNDQDSLGGVLQTCIRSSSARLVYKRHECVSCGGRRDRYTRDLAGAQLADVLEHYKPSRFCEHLASFFHPLI